MGNSKTLLYSGIVWIVSGAALLAYALMGLNNTAIPGIEELVAMVQGAEGWYIYPAVLLAIFIEGLYVVGSVFPGSSIVLLTAIISQAGGPAMFFSIIVTIFIGWNLAGIANVLLARVLKRSFFKNTTKIQSTKHPEISWFPAFRANTEVSEVIEGRPTRAVLWSSLKIKAVTSAALSIYALLIPFILDINNLNNEEGFIGLSVIAAISLIVGGQKIFEHKKKPKELDLDTN